MIRYLLVLFVLIAFSPLKLNAADVFLNKTNADAVSDRIPVFENASCKFSQEKLMKTSNSSLKSNGNFTFLKNKGVIFETTYPIHSTSSYTSGQNRIVNSIVNSISNKNYSYIEKNFDIFYVQNNNSWIMGLKPKKEKQTAGEMNYIQIFGRTDNKNGIINKLIIDTKSIRTTIQFSECE